MSNIYNIQQDLLALFGAIEDNEGDLTPELEEALAIKQEEFKDKIKSYSNVIKMLNTDIDAIKDEKDRLSELQKSKEKTIERLKKVMVEAIDEFGDSTKTGGKFIDYGTGKVSIKNTEAIDVDTDSVNRFMDRLSMFYKWQSDNNQMESNLIDTKELFDYINEKSVKEELEDVEVDKFTEQDISNLNASIDLEISVDNLISSEKGLKLLDALYKTGIMFKMKPKVNKTSIKQEAKGENHFVPIYANIINNKSVIIK